MNTLTVLFGCLYLFATVTAHRRILCGADALYALCPRGMHCLYPNNGERAYCYADVHQTMKPTVTPAVIACGRNTGPGFSCPWGMHCDYSRGELHGYCRIGDVHQTTRKPTVTPGVIACGTSVGRECPEGMHCDSLYGNGKIGVCHAGIAHPTPKPLPPILYCGGLFEFTCPEGMHCYMEHYEGKVGICHPGTVHRPYDDIFPRK